MPLFVLLFVLGMACHAREATPASGLPTGLCFALATMTRPEGVMIFAWSFVADAAGAFRKEPFPWRRWIVRGLTFAALYLPYYVWRYAYYGLPLPNTFYAKAGEGLAFADLGLAYVGSALSRLGPLVLLPFVLLWRRRENPRWALLSALTVLSYLGYLVLIGGDFRHHYRFMIPVLPPLLLLAQEGARRLWTTIPEKRRAVWRVAAIAAFLGCAVWAGVGMAGPAQKWTRYREIRNPQLYAVGDYFHELGPRDALMAISGGGVIPYVSELPAIEMWGLTDTHIAKTPARRIGRGVPGHMKGDGAYILSRRPRYILFIATLWTRRPATLAEVGENIAALSELDLWKDPRFRSLYRLRSAPLRGGGFTNYFERAEN
jgi:hypothetical protein